MTTNDEKIQQLRAKVEQARETEAHATATYYRLKAELERAEGNEFSARWSQAIVDGDSATAHACWVESCARRVLAGRASVEDYERSDRAEIAAEVERMKASQASPVDQTSAEV